MARTTFQKRQKEMKRMEKRRMKEERREQRKLEKRIDSDAPVDMEEKAAEPEPTQEQ
jgi:hypothetical protein